MRKSGKEIAQGCHQGHIGAPETHEWLKTANADELQEYLRWMPMSNHAWSQHGRDTLNVVLAKENIQLQKDIKRMTDENIQLQKDTGDMTNKMATMTTVITWLTVFIAILTLIQAMPIIKSFINSSANGSKSSINIQQPEKAPNQPAETNQIKTKNNDTLDKTKVINHKETPNK